ncbi:MAG: tetratricopeptide repeat protein, partial [Vicinamibacteria bacterium]
HPGALALLGNWTDAQTRAQIDRLKAAVVTIRSCAACVERQAFARFPLRAAILLHADREIQQSFHTPISEQVASCGAGRNADMVEHLAAILVLIDPNAGGFLRSFYLGMADQAEWSHCFEQSQTWARAGLKTYGSDAPLRMALGIAAEAGAFFTLTPAPQSPGGGAAMARQAGAIRARIRELQEDARQAFDRAVTADPQLTQARLRLGRMQWRLGQAENARASLEMVLAKTDDADLQYLAHLFLGRVLEDKGKLAEAEQHYRAAVGLQPLSETSAVALSHALYLRGDFEGARQALATGLEAAPKRVAYDPWVSYLVTQTNQGNVILAKLRGDLTR